MPPITIRNFGKGLWIDGPNDNMPGGTLRRAKGVHPSTRGDAHSRDGSILLYELNAHSLTRFDDIRYQGAGTNFYRDGSSIRSGLSGNRLTFVAIPPTLGVVDSLFVAGGGSLFKVDTEGNITNVGIAIPADPTVTAGISGSLTGTFKYKTAYKNSVTGTRSNGNTNEQSVVLAAQRGNIVFVASGDSQVDKLEVWRTTAGGSAFFLVATVDDTSSPYVDNLLDTQILAGDELPRDNTPPEATFQSIAIFEKRQFWLRDSAPGKAGNLYFSPVDRSEVVAGTIALTSNNDPTQVAIPWQGFLWVFTEGKIIQVSSGGTEGSFPTQEIEGAPGTINPFTVISTRDGIIYESIDSIMLFNGTRSEPLAMDAVRDIFRGETVEGIPAFVGNVATYGRDEYIISDGVTTLALRTTDNRWRNIGLGCNALFAEKDTTNIQASFSGKVHLLEEPGQVLDNEIAIAFEVEVPSQSTEQDVLGIATLLVIDADTNSQILTPKLITDEGEITLPLFVTKKRKRTEWTINANIKRASVRISGNVSKRVTIFAVSIEPYIPQPMSVGAAGPRG